MLNNSDVASSQYKEEGTIGEENIEGTKLEEPIKHHMSMFELDIKMNQELQNIYKNDLQLDENNRKLFLLFIDVNRDIFELYTKDNRTQFLENYNITKEIFGFSFWKDITYLHKLDKTLHNKYIYNLLSSSQQDLLQESLKVIKLDKHNNSKLMSTTNFNFVKLNTLDLQMDNKIHEFGMKQSLKMIYSLLSKNINKTDEEIAEYINTVLEQGNTQFPDNFGVVLHNNIGDNIYDYEVEYFNINFNQKTITLKEYIYYTFVYILLLYYIDNNMDIADYFKNEDIGMASNIKEYNYEDYNKLTTFLDNNFQQYLKDTYPESKLLQKGGNFDPHFIHEDVLPKCVEEEGLLKLDMTNILQINIEDLYTNNMDFKVNNKWFNKFSKMPCIDKTIEPSDPTEIFPHFIRSVVHRNNLTKNMSLLDIDTQINNEYLKWFYRPIILGTSKYNFMNMVKYLHIDKYNIYDSYIQNVDETIPESKVQMYPYYYTIYYNKLWMQLQCYNTAPNGFLNQMTENGNENLNSSFYDKYKNMSSTLTFLFPFIIGINITQKVNNEYKYTTLSLNSEQYYTIENIDKYDYIGYIYLPFKKDSRNLTKDTRLSKGRMEKGTAHLLYFIFKHKEKNTIVISNHRNKIYVFHQKETNVILLVELNIIGYLNKWDKSYNTWTLYPYLAIYTKKYKNYNNLYELDEEINHKTYLYTSTLNYDELKTKENELNNRFYENNESNNGNLQIQLNIPTEEEINNENNKENGVHLYLIPIIPILMHKNIKFICPKQDEYIIKDYKSLLENKVNNNNLIQGGNGKNTYFYKYLKYKYKYLKYKL